MLQVCHEEVRAHGPCYKCVMSLMNPSINLICFNQRSGGVVSRLLCATDVATAVAWHPAVASVVVGSLDGGIRFFSE